MSGVLLDTNALLWLLADDPALGPRARARLTSGSAGRTVFSSVSILEVTITQMLGRLTLPGDALDGARRAGLRELTFTGAHAAGLAEFPELVRHDPFDRMLLAQATTERLRLLTADRALLGLGLSHVDDARE